MAKKNVRAKGGIILPAEQPAAAGELRPVAWERRVVDTATVEVAVPEGEPPLWDVETRPQVVGKPLARLDGPVKVSGRADYTYDQHPPGLLYGKIVRSAYPHAKITRLELERARAMPGVRAVIRLDAADLQHSSAAAAAAEPGTPAAVQPRQAGGQSRNPIFAGDEIAAVAAESEEQAEDAARAVVVEYDPLPFVADIESARAPDAPRVHAGQPNVRELPAAHGEDGDRGDVHAGLLAAEARVEGEYRTPVALHNALETHGVVARWEARDKLTVWAATQGIFGVRGDLAQFFHLPPHRVRVITDYLGGGFGSKFGAGMAGIVAAWLAREAQAPVKLMYSRKEENLATGNRPSSQQQVRLGAKKDGTLTAIEVISYGTPGIGHGAGVGGAARRIYACANVRQQEHDVATNLGPAAAFRAPGWPQGSFALESALDELADKLEMDPLELRRKNYREKPFKALRRQYEIGAERIGWERRAHWQRGTGPVRRGLGMATACWPTFGGPPATARVTVQPDGTVTLTVGSQDLGGGTRMIAAQVTAEEFGLTPYQVRVELGDTRWELYGPASGGSVTVTSIAPAIRAAAWKAKNQWLEALAPGLGTTPDKLRLAGGMLHGAGAPLPFARACARLRQATISAQADRAPNYQRSLTEMYGAQFAEVEVDAETGRIRVLKIVAVHDCGRTMNRLLAESQVNGGVIMGLSYALYEERVVDRPTGRVMNTDLDFYKLAGTREIPEIEAILLDAIDPRGNNVNAKGLGEPPIVPTAAAIANAASHALGLRLRELPMTPDRVLNALAARA